MEARQQKAAARGGCGRAAEQWMERQGKFQTFFGPGIVAEMNPVPGGMDVALITDGSGQGKGGKEQGEVLPPLMPGMPARRKE